jgi:CTP synthase (UTP-ammonia lyase)
MIWAARHLQTPHLDVLQNIVEIIWNHFQLDPKLLEQVDEEPLRRWLELADCFENVRDTVTICLVGKYTGLNDAYASVIKALQHSALKAKHKLDLQVREGYLGMRIDDGSRSDTRSLWRQATWR